MGAQAAALLDEGGPLGLVPPDAGWDGSARLPVPDGWVLARTALAHAGVGLAPTAWDGQRLHLRLPGPVVVEPDATLRWRSSPPDPAVVRRVLALDDDLEPLWAACDRVASLRWVRPAGAGRVLRSPTVFQDLVGALAATRTSYRSTQAMVRRLVGDGAFPDPEQVRAREPTGWGYRGPRLHALADRVLAGWDPEALLDPALPDREVARQVRLLDGFGPFATASVLPLLGRPRPLVLDAWLRDRLGGASDTQVARRFAPMGRWAGTGAVLAATARRLQRAGAALSHD